MKDAASSATNSDRHGWFHQIGSIAAAVLVRLLDCVSAKPASAVAVVTTFIFFYPFLRAGSVNAGILYCGDVAGLYWPAMLKTRALLSAWNFTGIDFAHYNGSSDYFLAPNFFVLHPLIVIHSLFVPVGGDAFRALGRVLILIMALHSVCMCYFSTRLLTRFYGVEFAPATLIATGFTFGLNMIASFGQPQFLFCVSMMPCISYAGLAFAERPSWQSAVIASIPMFFGLFGGYVPLSVSCLGLAVVIVAIPLFVLQKPERDELAGPMRKFLLALVPIAVAACVAAPYYVAVYRYVKESISADTPSLFYSAHQLGQDPTSVLAHFSRHLRPPGPFAEFTFNAGFIAVTVLVVFLFGNGCLAALTSAEWRLLQVCAGIYFLVALSTFGNVSPISDMVYYFVPQVGGMHIYQRFLLPVHFFLMTAVAVMLRGVIAARPASAIKAAFAILSVVTLGCAHVVGRMPAAAEGLGMSNYIVYELLLCTLFVLALFVPTRAYVYGATIVLSLLPSLDLMYDYAHGGNALPAQRVLLPMVLERPQQERLLGFIDGLRRGRQAKEVVKYVDLTPLWASDGRESFPKALPYLLLNDRKVSSYHGFDFRMGPRADYLKKMPMAVRNGTWVIDPNWDIVAASNADFVVAPESDLQAGLLRGIVGEVSPDRVLKLPRGAVAVPIPQWGVDDPTDPRFVVDNGVFQIRRKDDEESVSLPPLTAGVTASQSSTWGERVAARAVDGETDGHLERSSVSQTQSDPNAWIDIDLGRVHAITQVRIWNVIGYEARLRNVRLFVSEKPFEAGDTAAALSQRAATRMFFPRAARPVTTVNVDGVRGRYVRLQLDGTSKPADAYLHVAEVQVFSRPDDGKRGSVRTADSAPKLLGYLSNDANNQRLEWECSVESRVRYLFSDNPRLQYVLDGSVVKPIERDGLVSFDVGAGRHVLEVLYRHNVMAAFWVLTAVYAVACSAALLSAFSERVYGAGSQHSA